MVRDFTLRGLIFACITALGILACVPQWASAASQSCTAARSVPLVPRNPALCASLAAVIRRPSAVPLNQYEAKLGEFLRNFCQRNTKAGWVRDKRVRETGPFTAMLQNHHWVGSGHGTHAPVVIWYSKEMYAWLKANRPLDESKAPAKPAPVPDGAVMIKEMYPEPAAACSGIDPLRLLPTSGAAVMVRDRNASQDGWFWGWFGWSGWDPDWPPGPHNRYPYMGFGQYCMNCHASARDNLTFASLRNIQGEPGQPLAFLVQQFFNTAPTQSHHRLVALPSDDPPRLGQPHFALQHGFRPRVKARDSTRAHLGHGLQDAVRDLRQRLGERRRTDGARPVRDLRPVHRLPRCRRHRAPVRHDPAQPARTTRCSTSRPTRTWRTSPMGLGGRDPIFYAQLASETETFHPRQSAPVQDICLGCHGITGPAPVRRSTSPSRKPARAAATSCARRRMPCPSRPTTPRPISQATARWRATASPAPPATTWCSARPRPTRSANAPQNRLRGGAPGPR